MLFRSVADPVIRERHNVSVIVACNERLANILLAMTGQRPQESLKVIDGFSTSVIPSAFKDFDDFMSDILKELRVRMAKDDSRSMITESDFARMSVLQSIV